MNNIPAIVRTNPLADDSRGPVVHGGLVGPVERAGQVGEVPRDGPDKPAETGGFAYAKRTMAADVVALARALGHDRFALVGHDRGALVAFRAALDHPDAVTHLATLDVLPALDMWDAMHGVSAAVGFHLYLMAQPPGLPETLIGGAPDAFFGHFLDAWTADPSAFSPGVRAAYLAASRAPIPSIVADYRASAGVDVEHDRADRESGNRLRMPVTVLQQDWGAALGFDAAALWGTATGGAPQPLAER